MQNMANSKVINQQGRDLRKYLEDTNAIAIGPNEDTHIHSANGTTDVLNIAIIQNIKYNWKVEVKDELSSDHLPVLLTLKMENNIKTQKPK